MATAYLPFSQVVTYLAPNLMAHRCVMSTPTRLPVVCVPIMPSAVAARHVSSPHVLWTCRFRLRVLIPWSATFCLRPMLPDVCLSRRRTFVASRTLLCCAAGCGSLAPVFACATSTELLSSAAAPGGPASSAARVSPLLHGPAKVVCPSERPWVGVVG